MADPYLDRDELGAFLAMCQPQFFGDISIKIDPRNGADIQHEYFVVLQIVAGRGLRTIGLNTKILVARLFPSMAAPFTYSEIATAVEAGELNGSYIAKIHQQLHHFRISVQWPIDAKNQLIGADAVRDVTHLGGLRCRLCIKASLPTIFAVHYSHNPFVALTVDPVVLSGFLKADILQEAWRCCWKSGIRFKEFT